MYALSTVLMVDRNVVRCSKYRRILMSSFLLFLVVARHVSMINATRPAVVLARAAVRLSGAWEMVSLANINVAPREARMLMSLYWDEFSVI